MNMVDLAAIIPFIFTVILETMDDIVIIGEILTVIPVVMSFFILSDMVLGILSS